MYIIIYPTLYPASSTIALALKFRELNRESSIALRALVIRNGHLVSAR